MGMYKENIVIITKTPFRMSFFGGGTDLPEYFKKNGGSVISTTFDKYCYVNVRKLPPFFDFKTELVYSKIERIQDVDKINHPAIKNAMKMCKIEDIRLTYEADLPARSGLGTSSSFAVGMLSAFNALNGKYIDKHSLSKEAIYLERTLCEEKGGWQDQIAATYGGLNRIDFKDNSYTVTPIVMGKERKKRLNNNLVMFFTGFTRFSSELQDTLIENIDKNKKNDELLEMQKLVDEAHKVLVDDTIELSNFGLLLHQAWILKKSSNVNVSNKDIDKLYDRGIAAGALGGKLLGAGSGGFMLFYVEPENKEKVLKEFDELINIPFEFEDEGSRVIYFNHDRD